LKYPQVFLCSSSICAKYTTRKWSGQYIQVSYVCKMPYG
jgi:hypothetical protein